MNYIRYTVLLSFISLTAFTASLSAAESVTPDLGLTVPSVSQAQIDTEKQAYQQTIKQAEGIQSAGHWYIGVGSGSGLPMGIGNSYNLPAGYINPPYTLPADTYKPTFQRDQFLAEFQLGYRVAVNRTWLPANSIGLNYLYGDGKTNGDIFENGTLNDYTYQYAIYRDTFLLIDKVNLFQFHNISPFVQGGIGLSINSAANYQETPDAGINWPRNSMAFINKTYEEFAYTIGAGVSYQFNQNWMISAEYDYDDAGKIGLGSGPYGPGNGPSQILRSNDILVSGQYLFG